MTTEAKAKGKKPSEVKKGDVIGLGWIVQAIRHRGPGRDWALIAKRGEGDKEEWVTGRCNEQSLAGDEWYWGRYMFHAEQAWKDYNER